MIKVFGKWALGLGLGALAISPAAAGQGADLLRLHLYGGTITAGIDEVRPLAEGGDREAKFALGVLTFFSGVEGLAQGLYRHGVASPSTGPMGPQVMLPVPVNPNPEPLTYADVRTMLSDLVDRMDESKTILLDAGRSGDYVVSLDPTLFRVDMNGDGVGDASESVAGILRNSFGMPDPITESVPGKKQKDKTGGGVPPNKPDTTIGFDRADAFWLAGYSQIFAGTADFLLAHDFSDFVNVSFHRLFPKAGLPMQDFSAGNSLMFDPDTDTALADAVAAIHTINWPVVEPDRLKRVRERMKTITSLSRQNWTAILAETDDNREWIPSPRQTSIIPGAIVTDDMVTTWLATLDVADKIVDGELLLPHWRFKQGFDLKAYFETATRTDLVMIFTGYGALPFLKDGPKVDANAFSEGNRVFGDAFPGYMLWFN